MKRDHLCFVAVIVGIFIFIFGCARDRGAVELVNYVNQGILNIADLEKRALERYASVTGENYTNDQRVYEALKVQVIPVYERFLQGLRLINPEEEEVRNLHVTYIRGAELLYEGFKAKMLGLERKDANIIRMANEKIENGRIENEKWRAELETLMKKYGVAAELKKEEKK